MSKQNHPELSIVIPARNEERRLPGSLQQIIEWLPNAPTTCEILVIVERSTDGTLECAQKCTEGNPAFRIIGNDTQRGKGFAVKKGMLAARGEVVFFMDADLSVPLGAIQMFYDTFKAEPNVSILVGNRQHPASQIVRAQGLLRRKMGQGFNQFVRLLSGLPLRDTQCGFKAFRREAAQKIFPLQTIDGFAFDVEILLLARKYGLAMHDLPVEWHNSSDSKVHIVRDSLAMLRDLVRVRWLLR